MQRAAAPCAAKVSYSNLHRAYRRAEHAMTRLCTGELLVSAPETELPPSANTVIRGFSHATALCAASPLAMLRVCDACADASISCTPWTDVWTISATRACSRFLLTKKELSTLTSVDLASEGKSSFA